jgi:hypothetical protein
MGVIVYPADQAKLVVEAVDPMCGHEGVGPCILGTPIESNDGRYAHIHPWSEAEMDYLAARVSGIKGAVVSDAMPKDWKGAKE